MGATVLLRPLAGVDVVSCEEVGIVLGQHSQGCLCYSSRDYRPELAVSDRAGFLGGASRRRA